MLGISSVLIKHQPCILLFWTLFDTCPYSYRHISLHFTSFISFIFWKNDVVFIPFFWKNSILFTYDFLEKSGKWKLGIHYAPSNWPLSATHQNNTSRQNIYWLCFALVLVDPAHLKQSVTIHNLGLHSCGNSSLEGLLRKLSSSSPETDSESS